MIFKDEYFNEKAVPPAGSEYVCWLDMMGTQQKMIDSMPRATIHIFKFHSILAKAKSENVSIYPVMDGVYISAKTFDDLTSYLISVFTALGGIIISTKKPENRFLVRGGIAFGPLLHGHDVPEQASIALHERQDIRNQILVGPSMSQAYQTESQAPPFGICLHDSVRLYALRTKKPPRYFDKWWKWWSSCATQDFSDGEFLQQLRTSINEYFDYACKHSYTLSYEKSSITKHKEQFAEYFLE